MVTFNRNIYFYVMSIRPHALWYMYMHAYTHTLFLQTYVTQLKAMQVQLNRMLKISDELVANEGIGAREAIREEVKDLKIQWEPLKDNVYDRYVCIRYMYMLHACVHVHADGVHGWCSSKLTCTCMYDHVIQRLKAMRGKSYTYTHTYMYIHTYMYMHTYIHTYIHMMKLCISLVKRTF